MLAIVCGGSILSWTPGQALVFSPSSLAVIAACLCWALDNNLTRNISDSDSVQIAAIKGLVAGSVNCTIALAIGCALPSLPVLMAAWIIGLLGYGLSLTLFIKALRYLGTARTGAFFSTAPFAGSALALMFLHEPLTVNLGIAGLLMAIGVYLHLTEIHEHEHLHDAQEHEHWHIHDEHHQHDHEANTQSGEPHKHWHRHEAIIHSHPHYPDTEHRHSH
jgi:drug/metabolite transporter (DMT)-like permease